MSPLLRYSALPFLLLFEVSVLYLLLVLLAASGVWGGPLEVVHGVLASLGVVGEFIDLIIVANIVIIVLLSIIAVPTFLFVRDLKKTLERFGLAGGSLPERPRGAYLDGAREDFAAHPEVALFVYGHTHRVSLTEVDDRLVLNTGTWLKRLHRKSVMLGPLPPVFYPS